MLQNPFLQRCGSALAVAICLTVPGLLPGSRALATTRTVNTDADHAVGACDAADCTLREAIQASIAGDTVNFAASLSDGTIFLSGTELTVGRNLTIVGPAGGVEVHANSSSRVFNITAGTVKLSNLSLRNGEVFGASGANATFSSAAQPGEAGAGGGLRNLGVLTLTNCSVTYCNAYGGAGGNGDSSTATESFGARGGDAFGGGIYNEGTLTLVNSTVQSSGVFGGEGGRTYDASGSDSRSSPGGDAGGGGIYSKNGSTLILKGCTVNYDYAYGGSGLPGGLTALGGNGGAALGGGLYSQSASSLSNCTVSGNTAQGGAGGAAGPSAAGFNPDGAGGPGLGGGLVGNAATLTNCTVSGNDVLGGASGGPTSVDGFAEGGGLDSSFPPPILRNTIIAGNTVQSSRPSGPDVAGSVSSQGHNLIGQTDGSSGWIASDLTGTSDAQLNPQLGPLQDNGGPTSTMAVAPGSVALDAGDDAVLNAPFNLATDQRGLPRKLGAHVDIGAFEFEPAQSGPTFTVTTTDEHRDNYCGAYDCSLWDAVDAANADSNANTITFKAGLGGTITTTLVPGGMALYYPVTINGPGAAKLTVSGRNSGRIFYIVSGARATISGLTVADGNVSFANYPVNAGGGIFNDHGNLTLQNCTLRNNHATFSGGVLNYGDAGSATLTLTQCTFVQNSATVSGGGLYNDGEHSGHGTVTLGQCTFDRNSATYGGGIFNDGESGGHATLNVSNCTFAANAATLGGGVDNDARAAGSATTHLTSCTLNLNTAPGNGGANLINQAVQSGYTTGTATVTLGNTILRADAAQKNIVSEVAVASGGYNLSSDNGGGYLTGSGDQISTDPRLDTLKNNGGPTDTMALLAGSAAIDKGKSFGAGTDQRGQLRPFNDPAIAPASGGDNADIGAYERQAPALSISDVTVTEGNAGTLNALFVVTLRDGPNASVSVHYATAAGTATAGSDYTTVPDTVLTFTAGQTSKTISVPILGDTLDEANETFKVNLSSPTGATLADGLGVGTIRDDDATPRFFIDDVPVTEGNSSTVNAVFHLTLSAASGRSVTVTYKTADGTATAGSDYVAHPSTTLTFTPGQTSKTITVLVNGDTLDEAVETFKVVLQTATNAAIVDDKGVGTITDNDPLPSLKISDAPAQAEGAAGTTHNALFVVTLNGATGRTVTVNYATANGTATAGSDYTAASGTITFTPGQTSKTLPIAVRGDATVEPDETFKVNLSGAGFATISDSQGVHTITNADASE